MIAFVRPELLLLALPWIGFWLWFARRQRRSCAWVWANVHERFHRRFTTYRPRTLGRRLAVLLLLGLLLVVAAAGPVARGETEVRELASRVVLLLDGSASMLADDVPAAEGAQVGESQTEESQTRFARGRRIAAELASRLEGSRFALVVFSGVAALQLPMTADPATVEEALGAASFHTFYQSGGSSFTAALDSALHFVDPGRDDLQAVLLSDGEQPFDEPFDEPLAALAEAGVPVHAVAIGSREGQSREIYDFRDVVAGKEEKAVLREFTTRREDRHLKRIARATGGRFARSDDRAGERLAEAIEERIAGARTVRAEGWRDLGGVPLTLFLVGFLLEALLRRRRDAPEPSFDIDRLGAGRPAAAAGLVLLLAAALATLACRDNSPLGRASRENERGIAADALESWSQARVHYDRSRAFGVQPEIPAFNLARSVALQEDWSEAHDLYQAALELSPGLAVGHYNDGHVLYRWGEEELDLEGCDLDRTLELWNAASRRFAGAAELFGEEGSGRESALGNLRAIAARIAQIEEACAPPPPPPPAGGGGGGGEGESQGGGGEPGQGDGGDGGESEGEGGGSAEDEGGGQAEDQGEGGGEGDDESQAEDQEDGEDPGDSEDQGDGEGRGDGEDPGEGENGDGDDDPGEGGGEGGREGDTSEGEGDSREGESGDGDGDAGPAPLTGDELEQVRQALERIGEERFADGRFHFRSRPEQFPKEVWENPDAEIWW
jgi:hypothetical protein